jgi:hypothetical protein
VTYRLVPETADNFFLIVESRAEFDQPEKGLIGQHALYDPGAVVTPDPAPADDEQGEWEIRIKADGEYSSVFYPFNPLDVVGWKGDLTVWKINLRDICPVMSPRVHLPPSAHTTFTTQGAVICLADIAEGDVADVLLRAGEIIRHYPGAAAVGRAADEWIEGTGIAECIRQACRFSFVPPTAEHEKVAASRHTCTTIHAVLPRSMRCRTSTKSPGIAVIFACPTIKVAFPTTVTGLVEDTDGQGTIRQTLQVRPGADSLDSDMPVNHVIPPLQ